MDRKAFWIGFGALLVIGLGAIIAVLFSQNNGLFGSVIEPPSPAPDIQLSDWAGHPFRLAEYRGKAVLLFFGYASCPDVCPATMAELRAAHSMLKPELAARVQVIFITVNPRRDTPARVYVVDTKSNLRLSFAFDVANDVRILPQGSGKSAKGTIPLILLRA
jgi:protein SCO1/2